MLHWNDKRWKDRKVFLRNVQDLMGGHTQWQCEAFNAGFLKLHAFTDVFDASDAKTLLEKVLPCGDNEYTITIENSEIIIINGDERHIVRRI